MDPPDCDGQVYHRPQHGARMKLRTNARHWVGIGREEWPDQELRDVQRLNALIMRSQVSPRLMPYFLDDSLG
jgi:hypothetical protein